MHGELSDQDFLQRFDPILQTFHSRKRRLENYAEILARLYPPNVDHSRRKILEIASGCDVFPALLRSKGYDAIGLEASPLVVRYCRIKNIKLISPETWDAPAWTQERFDIVVLISFITGPTEGEWAKRMRTRLCENISDQIRKGSDFLLFDLRWFDSIMEEFAKLDLMKNIDARKKRIKRIEFYLLTLRSCKEASARL